MTDKITAETVHTRTILFRMDSSSNVEIFITAPANSNVLGYWNPERGLTFYGDSCAGLFQESEKTNLAEGAMQFYFKNK